MVTSRRAACRRLHRPRRGYNLVILMVLVTVMNVLIAVALPAWSNVIRREKEKELIFRGLQYAEAIRVFQLRQGRYPTSLRELLEVEPRSIRQLWTDPFRDDGKWGLVLVQTQRGQQVGRDQAQGSLPEDLGLGDAEDGTDLEEVIPSEDVSQERDFGAPEGVRATGPVIGVRSLTEKEAFTTFMGSDSIEDWEFVAELIPMLPEAASLEVVPRLTSDYIGRAFPEGLGPAQGGLPGARSKAAGSRPSRPTARDDG